MACAKRLGAALAAPEKNMKAISLLLAVTFISGCTGMLDNGLLDYVRPNKPDTRSTNNKVADKPRETTLNVNADDSVSAPQDYKAAAARNRKAAEQGDANAQNNLGEMYQNGQGVIQDYKEAVTWYRKAAGQGHASAQNNLGGMYKTGQGVPTSRVVAYALYNLSAANDPSSTNIAASHRAYLAREMLAQEIDAAQNLTREMAKPNNLLNALDNYVRHPAIKEPSNP